MRIDTLKRYIKHPDDLLIEFAQRGWMNWLPDKQYIMLLYRLKTGKHLRLKCPVTYNEKLQWLKLHDRNPRYTMMADKYEAKRFVAERIGQEYCIPWVGRGVYNTASEIDYDTLPKQFVLKCTHDSGSSVVCKDKSTLNIEQVNRRLDARLKTPYYYIGRVWPYKHIVPRIIAEEYVANDDGSDILDYKLFCFHGIVKLIQVDMDRFSDHKRNFYDMNWHYVPVEFGCKTAPETSMPRPECLNDMIRIAQTLSKDIPHVRVDLYYVNRKILFGEMTFCHGSGLEYCSPPEFGVEMGSWLRLN